MMKRNHYTRSLLLSVSIVVSFVSLQAQESKSVLLLKGTEVNLKLAEPVNSAFLEKNNIVQLEVAIDVIGAGGIVVAQTGTYATGIVKKVQKKGVFGKNAKLEIEAISVKAMDGSSIPLEGRPLLKKGKKRTGMAVFIGTIAGASTGFILGANKENLSFEPAGLGAVSVGFFVQGSSVEIPLWEPLVAIVKNDCTIYISN